MIGSFFMQKTHSEYKRNYRYGNVWMDVFNRDGCCVECGSLNDLTIDHVIPVSLNGKSTLENMRVLCRSCNTRSGHRGRVLKMDKKNVWRRKYGAEWRLKNPGYQTKKSREFRINHPGYYRDICNHQDNLYLNAKQ